MNRAPPKATPASFHLLLLVLTFVSVTLAHFASFYSAPAFPALYAWLRWAGLQSLGFAAAVIAVLGSHEMGHYALARFHKVDSSLPYFIPAPFGFGTLGAVIRLKGRIPHRNALVDIGAAGPLAGLVVAIGALVLGLHWSHVVPVPAIPEAGFPSDSSLIVLLRELMEYLAGNRSGEAMGFMVFGDNLLTLFLQRVMMGPLPPQHEVVVHPVFIAGWFGCLVTTLNLFAIGQLDGGHLAFALLGKWAEPVGKAFSLGLGFLCLFYSAQWFVWLLLTSTVVGFRHPEVVSPDVPLSPLRKWICAACAVAFILCLMPIPLRVVTVP